MSDIGELLEEPGMVRGVWRIPGILFLLEGEDKLYSSPKFLFLGSGWGLGIGIKSKEWIGLCLWMGNCDSPKEVRFTIGIRTASGKEEERVRKCKIFSEENVCLWSEKEFLMVSDLQSRSTDLAPSGVLNICYTMESVSRRPSEGSLFSRLWNLSFSLKKMMSTEKCCDVTLNLKDGKLSAHRLILGSLSPVFERMFDVDLRESQTGVVNIEDATQRVFQVVLEYAYSGDPGGLSCENVCEVYKVAHKYEFEDLRKFCLKFMRETLCVDTVFDVMTVAHLYQEKALRMCVRNYFAKNKADVFNSEKWKTLKKENPTMVLEMLEWIFGEDI